MQDALTIKFRLSSKKSYLNINVDFVKDLIRNTA